MKVLEKGPGWGIEQKCTGKGNGGGGCGSKLLVEEKDIYLTEWKNLDYGIVYEIYYTFKCPVCKIETNINPGSIPLGIQNNVKRKHR